MYSLVQATSRYFSAFFRPGRGFFGPTRSGVSSMHTTCARVTRARIRASTSARAFAVRASIPWTNPTEGLAPVKDSNNCTHRWVGRWCTTIKYTTQD